MRALDVIRRWVGLTWPDPRFREIVEPYWEPGYGSSCMVVITAALEGAGAPPDRVNRGANWVPGDHMRPLIAWAKERGAFIDAPNVSELRPGYVYFLQRSTDSGADHAGIVESVRGNVMTTIDGGQSDAQGNQMVDRRVRKVGADGTVSSPLGARALAWAIDVDKLLGSDSGNPEVEMKTDAILAYMDMVEADWQKTQNAVAKQQAEAIVGKAPPLPFSRTDFLNERYAWYKWWQEQRDSVTDPITGSVGTWMWLSDEVYDAARTWHEKQKVWANMLAAPPKGQTTVGKPQPEDKPFFGFGSGFGTGIVVVGAALAGGYYLSKSGGGRRR